MMRATVTTHYLEMLDRSDFRPRWSPRTDLEFRRVVPAHGAVNKRWYIEVGGPWQWIDRLVWSDHDWQQYAVDPHVQTWVASAAGAEIGYAELQWQPGDNVEIVYFGLIPGASGQGLGGHFLSATIERAWDCAACRVWVHTCSLDHPAALPNYLARGFREYKRETHYQSLPANS